MTITFQGQSILVTGGAGFIGSHLVEKLVNLQAKVVVVDNLSTGHINHLAAVEKQIDFQQLDLLRDDLRPILAERQFATLFHMAGNVNVPLSVEDPQYDFEKNAQMTLNVLQALREASPETALIYPSSAAVYGRGSATPYRETDPTFPIAPYGVSKLTGEHYTRTFASLYGLRTACLRLFAVYGPRLRRQVVYDLIQKLYRDPHELFIYGDGTQVRDMSHVSNIVDALIIVAARGPLKGEIYNAGTDEFVTIRQLAEMICQEMGLSPKFVFSGDVRPGDAQHWTADLSRLRALGYQPRLKLAQGLADVVKWETTASWKGPI
ncbi:MAG: NAD-dependent epimerase/dehydratase family protein [Anaerolineales bacterium]